MLCVLLRHQNDVKTLNLYMPVGYQLLPCPNKLKKILGHNFWNTSLQCRKKREQCLREPFIDFFGIDNGHVKKFDPVLFLQQILFTREATNRLNKLHIKIFTCYRANILIFWTMQMYMNIVRISSKSWFSEWFFTKMTKVAFEYFNRTNILIINDSGLGVQVVLLAQITLNFR